MIKRYPIQAILLAVVATATATIIAQPVFAINLFNNCNDSSCSTVNQNKLDYASNHSFLWSMISGSIGILAGISVIMIVLAGIRYAVSQGNSTQIEAAKNTLLYAIIGLVVAMLGATVVALLMQFLKFK